MFGAKNEWSGVDAEYKLLSIIFKIIKKEWELLVQYLIEDSGKFYDKLVLQDEDGKVSVIYFDVTDFFGKPMGINSSHDHPSAPAGI